MPQLAHLQSLEFQAMGCHNQVHLNIGQASSYAAFDQIQAHLTTLKQSIQHKLDYWENVFSRFDKDSELMRLNSCTEQWVTVSEALYQVLQKAVDFHQTTQGRVTPTLLKSMQHLGYEQSLETLTKHQLGVSNMEQSARPPRIEKGLLLQQADKSCEYQPKIHQRIQLRKVTNEAENTYQVYITSDTAIDLNGYVKGWAANKLAYDISHHDTLPLPCLVDLGGDIAIGTMDGSTINWTVAVAAPYLSSLSGKPILSDKDVAIIRLTAGGIATSGQDYRRWWYKGKPHHHIIDPYSRVSAQSDLLTVTIIGENTLTAEVWAKYCLIVGQHKALSHLNHKRIAGLIINTQGQVLLSSAMTPYIVQETLCHSL